MKLPRFGDPVLLEVASSMPKRIRKKLMSLLELDEDDLFVVYGQIGMEVFWQLARIDRPALRYPPHHPYMSEDLSTAEQLFEAIRARDVLVHHPFDSFRTVENYVDSAATDPSVIGIKQTLYRVGSESPIVESLLDVDAIHGRRVDPLAGAQQLGIEADEVMERLDPPQQGTAAPGNRNPRARRPAASRVLRLSRPPRRYRVIASSPPPEVL